MKKVAIYLLILTSSVALGSYLVDQVSYFSTSSSYEKLMAAHPKTRVEVLQHLPGFREEIMTDSEEMDPRLRGDWGKEKTYARYYKHRGYPIDVIYNNDEIERIWPTFE